VKRAVVTGAAGFIGSHLSEALIARGYRVTGIDSFDTGYDRAIKESNVNGLDRSSGWELVEADLLEADLAGLFGSADVVFNLAGQPGVPGSWDRFDQYCQGNLVTVQKVLDAVRITRVPRLVHISSSSVYGDDAPAPSREGADPRPFSPYGVTKLASEHLCATYVANWGLPVVVLRYFTCYGPRQRPDMALRRLIGAGLDGTPFSLFGNEKVERDLVFVSDVVDATVLAGCCDCPPGLVLNVCTGTSTSLAAVIAMVEDALGVRLPLRREAARMGDVRRTRGSNDRARQVLGWAPEVDVLAGVSAQVRWQRQRSGS
jgi:UDP-glucuronate 4-epimerase